MDNRILHINGNTDEMLLNAIALAFAQNGVEHCRGFYADPKKGLILSVFEPEPPKAVFPITVAGTFPVPLKPKDVLPIVLAYLTTDDAFAVDLGERERAIDMDGDIVPGWSVHAGGRFGDICRITGCYLWLGK